MIFFFLTFVDNVLCQENSKNVFPNDKAFASLLLWQKNGSIDQLKFNGPLSSITRQKHTWVKRR